MTRMLLEILEKHSGFLLAAMRKLYTIKKMNNKNGFTLIEILVSVAIMLIFLPFAAQMITNSQLWASYAKHKIQAAYAAQQIIETQRQNAFVVLAQGQSPPIGPNSVILDTKGNYASVNCNNNTVFCGTSLITITPSVYTNSAGQTQTSTTTDHFLVKISWVEQILNLQIPMSENFAEDIVNDPMLN
jgi:prepilin-type N-terminal cleavage/methylation domain-containing protein